MPKYKLIISKDYVMTNYSSKKKQWQHFWASKKTNKIFKKKIIKTFKNYEYVIKYYKKIILSHHRIGLKYIKKDEEIIIMEIFCVSKGNGFSWCKLKNRIEILYWIKFRQEAPNIHKKQLTYLEREIEYLEWLKKIKLRKGDLSEHEKIVLAEYLEKFK